MKLQRIETPGISHYAYLLSAGNDAAIVDPRRDVSDYLALAREQGVRIRYILETHRQEDFVIGSSHLAELTGAQVVNGTHDCFGRGDIRLSHGDSIRLGGLRIEALETPGHTPESMCYAVYSAEDPNRAWAVFTGDTLFFGDTGRTDLPDEDLQDQNAARIYDSVHQSIAPLGDQALVFPAHGPGSVCGSGMVARSLSTIGDERAYNKVFTESREAFIARKGSERIPRPPYFRHLEEVNLRGGLAPRAVPDAVSLLSADELAEALAGDGVVIDGREPEAFAGGHVPGSYSVWLGGLPVFGGWVASHDTPVSLVLRDDGDAVRAVEHLSRIGIDEVQGYLAGGFSTWRDQGRPLQSCGVITPRQLAEDRDGAQVLDVREADEFAAGHIRGAHHVYVGHLEEQMSSLGLDPKRPVAVTCSVGNRAGLAASVLLRHGYDDVRNLLGGMSAWGNLRLPVEES